MIPNSQNDPFMNQSVKISSWIVEGNENGKGGMMKSGRINDNMHLQ
jgi:hypothetical protein